MYGLPLSGNTSATLGDYTLDFDLAKITGPTPTSVTVELYSPDFNETVVFKIADPATGAGLQHYSLNLASDSTSGTLPMSSITNLQVSVYYEGAPDGLGPTFVEYQLDNIVLALHPAPFSLGAHSPTGATVGLDQAISGSVIDAASQVESLFLYLDGNTTPVDGNTGYSTDGSATNTFTYNATGLSEGPHTVRLEATGTNSTTRSYIWDFYAAANGPTNPVGFEGFEAYPFGKWNASAATAANPVPYNNSGKTAPTATIVDDNGTNQMLRLAMNLDGAWQQGMYFNIGMNGANPSRDINDYVLQFNMHVTTNSIPNLGSFSLHIYDANNSLVGSSYNIATFDPGLADGVVTIPLKDVAGLATGAVKPMDGSASTWRLFFLVGGSGTAGDQPIQVDLDNMVVKYAKPPFLNETMSPQVLANEDPTVSATVYDGTEEIDNMTLYLDGVAVTNASFAGGSTTNTISYDWIGAPLGWHTGMVVAASATLYAETNVWTFAINGTPEPISNNPLDLFNINFAGFSGDSADNQYPVSDGTIAAAPSLGSNSWNNLLYNIYYWPGNAQTIVGSGGTNAITCEVMDSSVVRQMQIPYSYSGDYYSFAQAATNTIWPVTLGGTPINADLQLSGLDPAATYDLYLYYVNPGNADPATTTYTLTTGSSQILVARLTSTRDSLFVSGSYTNLGNYVKNENYVVIPGISPSAGGIIGINESGGPGGISAMQLVKRGVNIPQPIIKSFIMSGDTSFLTWGSTNGMTYSVLGTTNLVDGPWVEVTNGIPGTGSDVWVDLPATSGQQFFKVRLNR
jgi:hypothetical protein